MTGASRPGWASDAPVALGADVAAPQDEARPTPAPLVAFLASGPALLRRFVLAEALGRPAPGLAWFARRRPGPRPAGAQE